MEESRERCRIPPGPDWPQVPAPGLRESRAIQLAHAHLLTIKAERLGWPDPRNGNSHGGTDK
jgi:hypothetical protein